MPDTAFSPLLATRADLWMGADDVIDTGLAKRLAETMMRCTWAARHDSDQMPERLPVLIDFGGALTNAVFTRAARSCARSILHIGPQASAHVIPLSLLDASDAIPLATIARDAARTIAGMAPGLLDYDDLERLTELCQAVAVCDGGSILWLPWLLHSREARRILPALARDRERWPPDSAVWDCLHEPLLAPLTDKITTLLGPVLRSLRWRGFAAPAGSRPLVGPSLDDVATGRLLLVADLQTDYQACPRRARFVAEALMRGLKRQASNTEAFEIIVSFAQRAEETAFGSDRLRRTGPALRGAISRYASQKYGRRLVFVNADLHAFLGADGAAWYQETFGERVRIREHRRRPEAVPKQPETIKRLSGADLVRAIGL